jgi:predicted GNAT family N-acyltransferase
MASTNHLTTTKTMAPLLPRTYTADGNSYTLRSLSEDGSEIDSWCNFCASVFADKKPVPPSADYFARHYHNDPNRRASLIRVATVRRQNDGDFNKDDTEEIVASCRVFLRRVYVRRNDDDDDDDDGSNHGSADCDQVDLGGIGEVCTSIRHRRKGLSRELLNDCVRMMRDQARLRVSFLHSAPAFFPVYQGAGYCRTKTSWTVVPYHCGLHALSSASSSSSDGMRLSTSSAENPSGAIVGVRRARFPEDAAHLSTLYEELYSGVSGCLVRSRAYWDTYLGREWKDHVWVATTTTTTTAGSDEGTEGDGRNDDQLLGWMVARFRGSSSDTGTRRVQMCDGGVSPSVSPEAAAATEEVRSAASAVFGALLHRAVHELCRADDVLPSAASTYDLALPTLVANRLLLGVGSAWWFDSSQSRIEIDEGWMYKALGDSAEDLAVVDRLRSGDHLMWPADSF